MEPTRTLTRNEKLRVVNEEVGRLDDQIRSSRETIRARRTENAEIDFLAELRNGRSPQQRERVAENKKTIAEHEKIIADAAKAIERLYVYTEKELKTTLRSWY